MTSFLQLAVILVIILFAARMSGYLFTRFGQPSVLGELVIGLILGPSVLDVIHLPFITDMHLGEIVNSIGELGVFLLMFLAGIELNLADLKKSSRPSFFAGLLGVIVPVLMGWLMGVAIGMTTNQAIFLGLTLGATSVSISVQTLVELKLLRTRVGFGLLGAAVFDDILVILLLSLFLSISQGTGDIFSVVLVFLRILLFMGFSALFGLHLLPRWIRLVSRLGINQGLITYALIIMLIFGLAAELIGGMAGITGAFLAGLMFSRLAERKTIESGLHVLAYSLFVPVFFIMIGLSVNLRVIPPSEFLFFALFSLLAIFGKVLGAGLGSHLGGFSWLQALQLGCGMISRGEVGLIVAKVGLDNALLDNSVFSSVVGMVVITTIVTPPLLRYVFSLDMNKNTSIV